MENGLQPTDRSLLRTHIWRPPKDGIPSIDNPKFISVAEADQWLADPEPVQIVDINSDARAYPLQILMWHEIVNDIVGDQPVAVT
jgi:Protein of unknown function (DUF3179)